MLWAVDNSCRFTELHIDSLPLTSSLLFLPPLPSPSHFTFSTLQAATIFAGFPEQLPPFSKELQVFRDRCYLFPAKTVTAIHKSDKFLYIWELQDKISRNTLQNPNIQNHGDWPEMDYCPYWRKDCSSIDRLQGAGKDCRLSGIVRIERKDRTEDRNHRK